MQTDRTHQRLVNQGMTREASHELLQAPRAGAAVASHFFGNRSPEQCLGSQSAFLVEGCHASELARRLRWPALREVQPCAREQFVERQGFVRSDDCPR